MPALGTFQGGAFHPPFVANLFTAFHADTITSGAEGAALIPATPADLARTLATAHTHSFTARVHDFKYL